MELKGSSMDIERTVFDMLVAQRGAPGQGGACAGCAQYRARWQQRQACSAAPHALRCAAQQRLAAPPGLRAPCLRISRGSPTCATRSFMLPNSCSTACTHAATAAVSITT